MLDQLNNSMRKNYHKDLLVYKNPKSWKQYGSLKN